MGAAISVALCGYSLSGHRCVRCFRFVVTSAASSGCARGGCVVVSSGAIFAHRPDNCSACARVLDSLDEVGRRPGPNRRYGGPSRRGGADSSTVSARSRWADGRSSRACSLLHPMIGRLLALVAIGRLVGLALSRPSARSPSSSRICARLGITSAGSSVAARIWCERRP